MGEVEELLSLNPAPLSVKYKEREIVSDRVSLPFAVRLDGVRFSKALRGHAVREKPVHTALVEAGKELLKRFGGDFAFVSSDEINVVFLRNLPYGGRVFKIVSVFASLVGSIVSLKLSKPLFFDARAIQFREPSEIAEYIEYRMRVTGGNYIASLYHRITGRKKMPPMAEMLRVVGTSHENWMVFGTCIIPETIEKEAVNRKTGEKVKCTRRIYKEVSGYYECISRIRYLTYNMLRGTIYIPGDME